MSKAFPIPLPGHVRRVGMQCPHCYGNLEASQGAMNLYLACDCQPTTHKFLMTEEEERLHRSQSNKTE